MQRYTAPSQINCPFIISRSKKVPFFFLFTHLRIAVREARRNKGKILERPPIKEKGAWQPYSEREPSTETEVEKTVTFHKFRES